MRATLHRLLILCCALYLSGAHWVALQTTAWTGMFITRSLNTTVSEALESTFDGRHPCRVCELVAGGKRAEKRSQQEYELLQKAGDLKFVELQVVRVPPRPDGVAMRWNILSEFAGSRAEAPPTPPPLG